MNHSRYSTEPYQRLPKQQPLPQPQQPSQQTGAQQPGMQLSGGQHPGGQQFGVQQSLPVPPPSTSGAPIGPVTTPGAGTTPGETMVPGGSGVEAVPKLVPGGSGDDVPKLVPGEAPGIERIGADKAPCDAGGAVTGCRHEYGTSGAWGVVRIGEGMGSGALPVLGPTGICWATGRLPAGLKAKVLPPPLENNPAG
jgi:hypothetical protein